MRPKLFTPLLLNILAHHSAHAETYIYATPSQWLFGDSSGYDGGNNIPDASTSSHVTGIELGLTTTGAIYTVNILGDGVTRTAVPTGGCGTLSGTKHTFTVAANERVTLIEAWRNSDLMWYRLKLTLNTGVTKEYDQTPATGTNTLYTYTVLAGEEFTGFWMRGALIGCEVKCLEAISRAAVCSISIDLSAIDGQSQNVITDPVKSI